VRVAKELQKRYGSRFDRLLELIDEYPAIMATWLAREAADVRAAGLPAIVSNSAGTFVCNHVFYGLLHLSATRRLGLRGGFLHVPYLPSQAAGQDGVPSMALDDIVRGIEIVLTVAASRQGDIAAAEGMIS